jgi:predicted nucleotidyltransferase
LDYRCLESGTPMPTFDWSSYAGSLDWLPKRTAFLTIYGSHAYGLATETSDVDLKGFAIPPAEYFHGFLRKFEQAESRNPDMTIFDIRKFVQLAADCNPSVIEILWVDESEIIQINRFGRMLLDNREKFLSQKAKWTFCGYSMAQLKRIKVHRKYLLHPPTHKPTRSEFGLPETSIISKDIMGAIQNLEDKNVIAAHEDEFGPAVMAAYQRERSYHNSLREWQQYENWKTTRNPARAALEAKYSIDTKHAMHLVRLMRMCREILAEGRVVVKRPDRDELLAIRNGAWTYEQIVEWAERQDVELTELADRSPLPHAPDRNFLQELCCQIVDGALRE